MLTRPESSALTFNLVGLTALFWNNLWFRKTIQIRKFLYEYNDVQAVNFVSSILSKKVLPSQAQFPTIIQEVQSNKLNSTA